MRFIRIIFSLAICLSSFQGFGQLASSHSNANKGFALVELFTSEGCSSCPAAETLLKQIAGEYPENVYVLEYHVDYWNYLGWKDAFGNSLFTERQSAYASKIKNSSVYTPQAVVNGKSEFVGSDRNKMKTAVENGLNINAGNTIILSASKSERIIRISYSLKAFKGQLLNIALVQKHAETNVRKGENGGRKLQHINVVRSLKTIEPDKLNGEVMIELPTDLSPDNCSIIAYAQDSNSWEVTGAEVLGIIK